MHVLYKQTPGCKFSNKCKSHTSYYRTFPDKQDVQADVFPMSESVEGGTN